MRRKTTPKQKAKSGALGLILATLVLAGIGTLLNDARQVPFGFFGGLVWGSAVLVSFMFGLLYFAQFVLPLRGNEGWSEGLRLLWRHYTHLADHYLNVLFTVAAPPPGPNKEKLLSAPGEIQLPTSFQKLNAGVVPGHHVLALSKGTGFSRAAGPGFVMLYRGERVTHLIDLRKLMRRQTVKANTRDGIPVETSVSVTFRVRQSEPPSSTYGEDQLQYPYDKDAIFHVAYASSIDDSDRLYPWTEQLIPRAAAMLVAELAHYTLNELFPADGAGMARLDEVKQKVKQQLEQIFNQNGIEILGVGIGQFVLPSPVTEQRIKAWQAEWQREITVQHAAGEAEAERRVKKAKARAQIELIENITQNIEAMRRVENANLTEIITLRMIEVLSEAMTDEAVQALIPQQVIANLVTDASTQMQTWLNRPPEDQ